MIIGGRAGQAGFALRHYSDAFRCHLPIWPQNHACQQAGARGLWRSFIPVKQNSIDLVVFYSRPAALACVASFGAPGQEWSWPFSTIFPPGWQPRRCLSLSPATTGWFRPFRWCIFWRWQRSSSLRRMSICGRWVCWSVMWRWPMWRSAFCPFCGARWGCWLLPACC